MISKRSWTLSGVFCSLFGGQILLASQQYAEEEEKFEVQQEDLESYEVAGVELFSKKPLVQVISDYFELEDILNVPAKEKAETGYIPDVFKTLGLEETKFSEFLEAILRDWITKNGHNGLSLSAAISHYFNVSKTISLVHGGTDISAIGMMDALDDIQALYEMLTSQENTIAFLGRNESIRAKQTGFTLMLAMDIKATENILLFEATRLLNIKLKEMVSEVEHLSDNQKAPRWNALWENLLQNEISLAVQDQALVKRYIGHSPHLETTLKERAHTIFYMAHTYAKYIEKVARGGSLPPEEKNLILDTADLSPAVRDFFTDEIRQRSLSEGSDDPSEVKPAGIFRYGQVIELGAHTNPLPISPGFKGYLMHLKNRTHIAWDAKPLEVEEE